MFTNTRARSLAVLTIVGAAAALLTGCNSGSGGDDNHLSILVDNTENTVNAVQAMADAYMKKNPDVTVELETRPQGGDGDNVVKTRLQSGDMTDILMYNAGSLLQALSPEQTLVDLSGQDFIGNINDTFKAGVTFDDKVYGVPGATGSGGGILYNKEIYADLSLEVPKTWDEFMANNQKILDADIAPVIQSYGPESTWTSQMLLLSNNYNVLAADPEFPEQYTANQANFSNTPAAFQGFQNLQDLHDEGYLNSDYGSTTYADALTKLTSGEGAQYPILSFAVNEIAATNPDALDNIGLFAVPGDDSDNAGLTTWLSQGMYIPQTTQNKDLALDFLAFVATPEACEAQTSAVAPAGPYFVDGCTLPEDVPGAVQDLQAYFDEGLTAPALEFLSPVKGPALEQILVEVGSGIRSATDGAALYDQDVTKQAQQLGLEGW